MRASSEDQHGGWLSTMMLTKIKVQHGGWPSTTMSMLIIESPGVSLAINAGVDEEEVQHGGWPSTTMSTLNISSAWRLAVDDDVNDYASPADAGS